MIKFSAGKTTSKLLSTSALAVSLVASLMPSQAFAIDDLALPTNGQVVGGAANFSNPSAGVLNIHQNTDRVVINWDSFNIGANAKTEFFQNNSNSLAVNRVTGDHADPTQILGTLKANGRVMVLDRNGVFFGKDAVIDVGGIVASTGDVDTSAIMNGDATLKLSNFGNGAIINEGLINVQDAGLAAFVAPTVINNGVINAKLGKVALAAGAESATVDLYGDGLVELALNDEKTNALVKNAGVINAEGGTVALTASAAKDAVDEVINVSGIVNVSSVEVKGGKIILSGGKSGTVKVSGKLKADGKTGGGKIDVKGKDIHVAEDAVISANATSTGKGGDVVVFADHATFVDGKLSAKGGTQSGDGGFIETSGLFVNVSDTASIDASAANGLSGNWLLDPLSIIIANGVTGGFIDLNFQDYTKVGVNTINAALNSGTSVTIQTGGTTSSNTTNAGSFLPDNNEGDIRVRANISKTAGGDASFSLIADDDIYFENNANITSTAGKLNVNLTAKGTDIDVLDLPDGINIKSGSNIKTNGGNITFTTPSNISIGGTVDAQGGNIAFTNKGVLNASANSVKTSGTGTISLQQNKVLGLFGTIQNAIDSIQNTGTGLNTIDVGAGFYAEAVNANENNLVLKGANAGVAGNATRVAETTIGIAGDAVTITADNVTLDGFEIGTVVTGVKVAGTADKANIKNNKINNAVNGIVANSGASNLEVGNNKISDVLTSAVSLDGVTSANIHHNVLNNATQGVLSQNSSSVLIDTNQISNATNAGVDLRSGNNGSTVQGNTISGSKYGVLVGATNTSTLIGSMGPNAAKTNTITGGMTGISVDGATNTWIEENNVSGSSDAGIEIKNGNGYSFVNYNKVNSTKDGIRAQNTAALIGGNKIGVTGALTGTGIAVTQGSDVQVVSNEVTQTALNGISVSNSVDASIKDNIVYKTGSHGINVNASNGASILRNEIGQKLGVAQGGSNVNGNGINLIASDNVTISRNKVSQTSSSGVAIEGGANLTVTLNQIKNAIGNGIYVAGPYGGPVTVLTIADNQIVDTNQSAILLNKWNGAEIRNNTITGANNHGVTLDLTTGTKVTGNTISGVGGAGVNLNYGNDGVVIQSNTVNNSKYGVQVEATDNKNTTVGFKIGEDPTAKANTFTGGTTGVKVNGGENLRVAGNTISGQSDAGIDIANAGGAFTILDFNKINATKDGIRITNTNATIIDNRVGLINSLTGNGIVLNNADGTQVLSNRLSNVALDGIKINGSDNVSVETNELNVIGQSGISADDSDVITIKGNKITSSNTAINLSNLDSATVTRNTIDAAKIGISLNAVDNVVVGGSVSNKNTIKNTVGGYFNAGINIAGGSNITVDNNVFSNNGSQGIVAVGPYAGPVTTLDITNNTFTNTDFDAINLSKWNGAKIQGNTIDGSANAGGITLALTTDTKVLNNTIKNLGGTAIGIAYGNDGTVVQGNTLTNNKYGVVLSQVGTTGNTNTLIGSFATVNPLQANTITGGTTGILVTGGENLWVEGNTISGQSDASVDITNSGGAYTIVSYNKVDSTKDGIRITGTPALIAGNKIGLTGNLTGNAITVSSSDDAQVLSNQISNVALDGVKVSGGTNVRIETNELNTIGQSGITADNSDMITVKGNKVTGSNTAINLSNLDGATVTRNTIDAAKTGINLNAVDNVVVGGSVSNKNTIKNTVSGYSNAGINIAGGSNIIVDNNVFTNTGGQSIVAVGPYAGPVTTLDITNNTFTNTDFDAINLSKWNGAKIQGNSIDGSANGNGISLALTTGTKVLNNTIKNLLGGSAIGLYYGNDGTVVQGNTLNNNKYGVVLSQVGTTGNTNTLIGSFATLNPAQANIITGGTTGILVTGGENLWVEGNTISGQSDAGVDITNSGGAYTIVNYNKVDATKDGIRVTGTPATVAGNKIGLTGNLTGNGVVVSSSDGAQVLSNQISNVAKTGIRINSGSKNIEISDNILKNIGNEGIRTNQVATLKIQRNNLDNVSWNGIDVQGGTNAVVNTNKLNNVRGNGIQVSGTTKVDVKNNDVGAIRLAGIVVNDAKTVAIEGNLVNNTGTDAIVAARNEALQVLKNFVGYTDRVGTAGASDNVKGNGVSVGASKDVSIAENKIINTKNDGVAVTGGSNLTVGGANATFANTITNTGDDGIDINGVTGPVLVGSNTVTSTINNGISVNNVSGVEVRNNKVTTTTAISSNGINISNSVGAIVNNNDVSGAGGNGIYVFNSDDSVIRRNDVTNSVLSGIVADGSDNVRIGGTVAQANTVNGTQVGSGIKVVGGADNLVRNNVVSNTGVDGINATNTSGITISGNKVTGFFGDGVMVDGVNGTALIANNDISFSTGTSSNGIFATDANRVVVRDNTVARVSGHGIQVTQTNNVNVRDNSIDRVLRNGIDLRGNRNVIVDTNTVTRATRNGVLLRNNDNVNLVSNLITNSGARGLYAAGANNGSVVLIGNTLTDNTIGAEFESGVIDLTATGVDANIINGGNVGLRFDQAGPLSLVNNTFGETFFNGQAQYYIELANGAFFAPGNPSVLDARASTFDGFRPDTQAFLTLAQYNDLESRIFHFADNASLGLIFFGSLPEIDQEDILRQIAGFRTGVGGLSITIRGLPMVAANTALRAASGGNTALALANISPAAGGDEVSSAENVANIEPAAGDEQVEQTSCWSDAAAGAASGSTMSYSFGGSSDSLLSSAAGGCQSGSL